MPATSSRAPLERLFAVARDPRTIFVYWRLSPFRLETHDTWRLCYRDDTGQGGLIAVEPHARNWYLPVLPGRSYYLEFGYLDPEGKFQSVLHAAPIAMPATPELAPAGDWPGLDDEFLQRQAAAAFPGASRPATLTREPVEPIWLPPPPAHPAKGPSDP